MLVANRLEMTLQGSPILSLSDDLFPLILNLKWHSYAHP
jgi:hypothetical protein